MGRLFIACVAISCSLALRSPGTQGERQLSDPVDTFERLLKEMASEPADPCLATGRDDGRLEDELFAQADRAMVRALNGAPGRASDDGTANPRARLVQMLARLERIGADVNRGWPEEKRFHAWVIDVPPALLVGMTYRNRATFSFFAVPERGSDDKPTTLWHVADVLDNGRFEPQTGYNWLNLFPLERGPSRRARFLAEFGGAGCGAGVGVAYLVYEWNARGVGRLSELIKVEGAVSQEDPIDERAARKKDLSSYFPPVGELKTTGPLITLPYCWFSAIDTWDNPSLCAVDTYDISRDRPRFAGRVVNRPDVLPIAQAIEHAWAHDYPAVQAYCASADVARRIVRDLPPLVSAVGSLTVTRIGPSKETVEIEDLDQAYRFEVQKQADRWLVTSFQVK